MREDWVSSSRRRTVLRALPTGTEPAPPARRLLTFRGRAHVHVSDQAVGPYPDERGARTAGHGSEPQFTVAQHVEPCEFHLHALRHVNAQVAEQRGSGDVDHVVADDYVPQVEIDVPEQR